MNEGLPSRPRVLFLRRMRRFRGAHLTMWHYFGHVEAAGFEPHIWFAEGTTWTADNPWRAVRERVVGTWQPQDFDALVLGGMDWEFLAPELRDAPPLPVLSLVLHVRRADPADAAFGYLRHPAIRIGATSDLVSRLRDCGAANGPVVLNPHGLDTSAMPEARADSARDFDAVILGVKQPDLARRLARRLRWSVGTFGARVETIVDPLPRADLLARFARARVAVLLPHAEEGFYRPPLEAMALGALVVCPRFDGNRDLCVAGTNCLMPAYDEDAILRAIREALRLHGAARASLVAAARERAWSWTLDDDRRGLCEILRTQALAGRWPASQAMLAGR